MSGLRLYQISAAYRDAFDMTIDPETGEVSDDAAMVARLDAIGDALAVKVDAVLRYRADAKARALAAKAEIQRLQRIATVCENTAERLEQYVEHCMRGAGTTEIKGDLFTAKIQPNPPAVVIDDESAIPPRFVQVEQKIKKGEIAKAIKAGEEVPGAHLEQSTSIRIK